jgi:bifunctional DNA-binding transcriptional regulator/antitoxin component of YhaV-PrlF toxin-antitoxin module
MIQSIQKVIKIGSSGGVTIPAKELKRQNIAFGDEVEVIVRPLHKEVSAEDEKVIAAAKDILSTYKKDFDNLAQR